MGIFMSTTYRCAVRGLLGLAALLAATLAHSQNLSIAEANSTNDRVYSLGNIGTNNVTTTFQNTDSGSFAHIQSLAFLANPNSKALDLIVADTGGGKLAVYPGYFASGDPTTATVIWTAAQGGPAAPDGLSVDLAGDLFVVNTSAGNPQLWVFPAAGSTACTTPLPYAPLCAPVRVDNGATFASGQVLVETAIVPSITAGLASSGDLLVLTRNPASVLDFPVPAFVGSPITATTLLPQTGVPLPTTPGGLAFWPVDNSLLVTDQTGNTVQRYSCCSSPITAMTAFTSDYPNLGGSGLNMYKIKTGTESGQALAFVAQAGSVGHLLEFNEGSDGSGFLLETISPKGNHPQGLALTFVAAAAANACTPPGCNPTGFITHTVIQNCNPQKTNCTPPIVENICVVPQDPRWTSSGNPPTWSFQAVPLLVNSVCPGFDNTGNMVISAYVRGQSGDAATPRGFTLIQTLVDDSQFNDTIVDNETSSVVANEPLCRPGAGNNPSLDAVLWAPLRGQGTYYFDGTTNEMGEITSGCGSGRALSNGGSLWGLGFALNLSAPSLNGGGTVGSLGVLGDNKHQDLEQTVQTTLASVITNNANNVNVGTLLSNNNTTGCVPLSKAYLDFAQLEPANSSGWLQDLTIAADLLSNADTSANPITCDSIVTTYLSAFGQSTGSPPVYNSSGQVRSRLANLYFTINSRILGNPPNSGSVASWPPNPAPNPPPNGYPNACMGPGSNQYPPPGGCPTLSVPATVQAGTSLTASYTLNGLNAGCTLTSGDGTFTNTAAPPNAANPPAYPFSGSVMGTVPLAATPGVYTYTLSCPFPNNAAFPVVTVSGSVTVTAPPAPPTISVPMSVAAGTGFNVTWNLYSSTGCTLNSGGGDTTFNGQAVTGSSGPPYTPVTQPVTATATPGAYTYTLNCSAPASSATATLNVTEPLTISVSPTKITDDGQVATITWTAPSSGCKVTDSSSNRRGPGGTLSGATSSSAAGSFTASYKSGEADGGYTITFTATCTSGGSASAKLGVTE